MIRKLITLQICFLLALIEFISPQVSFANEGKEYTLAVLDLIGYEISIGEAKGLSDKLRSHISQLINSDTYKSKKNVDQLILVERTQMDKIFDQFDIQNIECVSDSCAIEFGKMLQVDRIIIGSISLIGQTYSIIARTVDVETGKTFSSSDRQHRGSIDDVLSSVIPDVGDELTLGTRRKSRKKWYIIGSAIVAGTIGASIIQSQNDNSDQTGAIIINVPLPE